MTGLGGLGVPTFQAVRPLSRSLSVSQGKGLTPMAAAVSALLEAVELDSAERLASPPGPPAPLRALGSHALATWSKAARDPAGIALDPDLPRRWLPGRDLPTGRAVPVPHDLLRLDSTERPPADVHPVSVGLATGNTPGEALVGAVAELVEHDLAAAFDALEPADRRAVQLDAASVDDPWPRALLGRFAAAGFAARVWSMGQGTGVAAFRCTLWPERAGASDMAPVAGSGCHPDRRVALLRALLEAAQARATVVAGARDDLCPADYRDGARRQMELVLDTLSFGPGPLAWADVADHRPDRSHLDALLDYAARRSPLPVIAVAHPQQHPDLHIVHAVAPGLRQAGRDAPPQPAARAPAPAIVRGRPARAPVLFAGPSLPPGFAAPGIELRPPARCGDLAALLADPPPAVGLVDGCFELAPTVWHKELLDLLAHGVAVLGGASLGAIRAAELAGAGMRGIGAVFVAYASGAVGRDDAVMLDHAPAALGYRALTLSLVDAECALRQVPMPPAERRALQRIVRRACYRERTWALCLARLADWTGRPPAVDPAALAAVPSLKRTDALALVAALPGAVGTRGPRPPLTGDYRRLLATLPPAPPPARRAGSPGAPRT